MQDADKVLLVQRLQRWGYLDRQESYVEAFSREDIERAVRDYQAFHTVPLNRIAMAIHKRDADADGIVGPATRHLMDTRFCDAPDPVSRMVSEELRWPDSCKDLITISWNFLAMPGLNESQTTGIWLATVEEFNRLFDLRLTLNKDAYPNTRIFAGLKALPGPTLAWAYMATGNCGSRLQMAIDNTIKWSLPLGTGTLKHEVGHTLGLEHTPNDPDSLMFPSMRGQTGLNQTDIDQMIDKGYRLRTDPPPPPPPPPPGGPVKVLVIANGRTYSHVWAANEAQAGVDFLPM